MSGWPRAEKSSPVVGSSSGRRKSNSFVLTGSKSTRRMIRSSLFTRVGQGQILMGIWQILA
jgi:hypothetical protein